MKKLSVNIITSLLLQICTIISGLIIPRLILQTFGSTVNGLVSSINQFSNYIILLEGGVSSVMLANLYQPLYEKNIPKLSSVFAAMNRFFRRISLIFLVYQILLAIVYPFLVDTGFQWKYVFSLTLILGINLFVQYNFSISLRLLLEADNKLYITKIVQIIIVVLNTVFVYIGIKIYPDIHIVKLITAAVYLLQPLCYHYFVSKEYDIDKTAIPDSAAIKQRWDGFGINLAAFMHNNTDIVILTFFTSLITVSVYNVYLYVVSGIKQLVIGILAGFIPVLGRTIAMGDKEKLNKFFQKYEFFSAAIVTFSFALGSMLIIPFERFYTRNIHDAEYIQPVFAVLMLLAEGFYCMREPYVELAYQSNKFKEIKKYAYIEALINILISLLLVSKFELLGVAVGTLAAMFYRTVFHVIYAVQLLGRKLSFMKYLLAFGSSSLIANIIIRLLPIYQTGSNLGFVFLVVCSFFILILLHMLAVLLFFPDKLRAFNQFNFKSK